MITEPQTDLTAEETFESLNGFEEIAIAKHFGAQVTTLAEDQPTMFMRALIFTLETRSETAAPQAKETAMRYTLGECDAYFTPDPEDPDPEEPDSESGKDDSSQGGSPTP